MHADSNTDMKRTKKFAELRQKLNDETRQMKEIVYQLDSLLVELHNIAGCPDQEETDFDIQVHEMIDSILGEMQ